jgi:hypothetical protein
MKFTGSFKAPRINVAAYRQKLQEVLGDAIAHAAFEWLGATVQEVPVWSGASRATFMPLASLIGFQVRSTQSSGVAESTSGSVTRQVTSKRTATGVFTFTYATSLEHLIFNEFNNGNIVQALANSVNSRTQAPTTSKRRGLRHSDGLPQTCGSPKSNSRSDLQGELNGRRDQTTLGFDASQALDTLKLLDRTRGIRVEAKHAQQLVSRRFQFDRAGKTVAALKQITSSANDAATALAKANSAVGRWTGIAGGSTKRLVQ